jgi:hypothetical protein
MNTRGSTPVNCSLERRLRRAETCVPWRGERLDYQQRHDNCQTLGEQQKHEIRQILTAVIEDDWKPHHPCPINTSRADIAKRFEFIGLWKQQHQYPCYESAMVRGCHLLAFFATEYMPTSTMLAVTWRIHAIETKANT